MGGRVFNWVGIVSISNGRIVDREREKEMKYARTSTGQKVRIIRSVGQLHYCRFENTKGFVYHMWVREDELTPTKTEVFIRFCEWCGLRRADAVNILIIGQYVAIGLIWAVIGKVLYAVFV